MANLPRYEYTNMTAMEARDREFNAGMKVVRGSESIGRALQELGLKCRWSTKNPQSDIYIDPVTMLDQVRGNVDVKLLFDCNNVDMFLQEVKMLKALKEQHTKITKLRAESPEFEAMWKELEFTMLLGS